MSSLQHVPAPVEPGHLAALLEDIAAQVKSGDCMEGFLEWQISEDAQQGPPLLLRARYRSGGGLAMVGRLQAQRS